MKPIGILGGGQLARMLVLEAHRLNLPVAILSPLESDPARTVTGSWHKGNPNKSDDLLRFMKLCSSVTYESEFFDAALIESVSKQTKTPVFPEPVLMAKLQDRLTQKSLFDDCDLPTSPWRPVDSQNDALVAYVALGRRVVFKKRRGGYDGNGTFIVRGDRELTDFVGKMGKESYIAEKLVRFKREVAVVAVRDQRGAIFFFPFTETFQKDARCLWVKGPLKETKIFGDLKTRIAHFLKRTNYVGAMGIEIFDTGKELIINEIAPRVHNSGHYTMDAFDLNQFSLHLRAVSMFPLPRGFAVPTSKAFAMWNLIGDVPSSDLRPWFSKPSTTEAKVHWYGKLESKPGRKMGHVNALAKKPELALKIAQQAAKQARRDIGF